IVDLHFHDLRREFGSRLMESGAPIHTVRDYLGHADISQTSTYLATSLIGLEAAMRQFEKSHPIVTNIATSDAATTSTPNTGTSGKSLPDEELEIGRDAGI
ncbi:MAG TPA: tyrosine-type recombinase/integrase, partial [Vicinamibacterales bacterium]|nr:tyrosine-type recombinase/integrase [Vicinamibacterales bacterium]